ncbi:MAG TPA: SCP2 sterol-binding domain-containing protein [Solimonas sp.]|nr:SCP2 sterol-binding domain-containing protein [Solimonas sp.]
MTPALLCAAVEVALNRYLRLEPEVLAECERLRGRGIALAAEAPAWLLFIEFAEGGVRVLAEPPQAPEVSVRGSLPVLLRLAWQVSQGESGIPQGLEVEGDVELLHRFNRLLARVGFDPEELLARYLGDAAGHRAAQGLKGLLGWARRTAGTLGLDTAEYLREETRDLARASDAAEWMDQVDHLRDDVERFEARLQRLERRRGVSP